MSMSWAGRITGLVLLALVYGAGLAAGRDHALQHPVCHLNLKP